MEKFLMAAETAVRVSDLGRGRQVILLLHGYLESLEVWDELAGQLGRSYRVIRMDLPGHGFSQWGDRQTIDMDYLGDVVAGVLQALLEPGERCTAVGHSMGGYAALALAANHPQWVEGLVLFHSSPNGDTPEKREYRQREIELVQAGKKEMLARVNPGRGFAPGSLQRCAETVEELAQQVMLTEDRAVVAILRGMAERPDRNEMMRGLGIPELMIFGRQDNYISISAAELMISAQPQAAVAWLERSGHMGFVEEPKESLRVLEDFLSQVASL